MLYACICAHETQPLTHLERLLTAVSILNDNIHLSLSPTMKYGFESTHYK